MHTGIKEKMIRVDYTQGDLNGRMKPGSVLRAVQQISMEHCDDLGFTVPVMMERNRVFVLIKLLIDVERMPMEGETVRLTTYAYAPKRLAYQRVTKLESPDGEPLVTVDARWTMVDTATWRITRAVEEDLVAQMLPVQDFDDIRMPKIEFTGERPEVRVRYTMLDTNKHVNNAVYADWVQDALEPELLGGAQIRRMSLLYHREARPGDIVRILHASDNNTHYLRGEHKGGNCFESVVELTEAQ